MSIEIRGGFIRLNIVQTETRKADYEWIKIESIGRIRKHISIQEFVQIVHIDKWLTVKSSELDILEAIEHYKEFPESGSFQ